MYSSHFISIYIRSVIWPFNQKTSIHRLRYRNASSCRHSCFDVGVLSFWRTNQHTSFDYELKQHRFWGLGKDNNEDWLSNPPVTSLIRHTQTQLFGVQSFPTTPPCLHQPASISTRPTLDTSY